MITKVVHGWRVGGLIAYLMGPGRANEHVRPRVIASWDGRDTHWQPASTGPRDTDLELGPLIRAVRAPAVAAGLPEGNPDGKRGYVWHCSARVARADRVLSDAQWAAIARELLHEAGVATRRDAGGPRWVAIRHADDHIHIAVVLVRQDTSRRFWPSHDYPRLRTAARRIEARLGLTITAPNDGTAAPAPTRGEIEKAARHGREPARVELARAARTAAVNASNPAEFTAALREAGYLVELRRAPSGDLLGYKLARPDDLTASGSPVFYSGSKLAPDLSLPRLMRTWNQAAQGTDTAAPIDAARRRLDQARTAIAAVRRGQGREDPGEIAHATADLLTAIRDWSPDLATAADAFDRAARPPRHTGEQSRDPTISSGLRRVARQLLRQRRAQRTWPPEPDTATVALAVALVALLTEISAWQRDQHRDHQAAAAQHAAVAVTAWSAMWSPPGAAPDSRVAERADQRQRVKTPPRRI